MARVQQQLIDKALKVIGNLMTSPAFPSNDDLLTSGRTLCNVVDMVRAGDGNILDKTICRLLVEALGLGNDVTGEALWKRYRRATTNRDGSGTNKDTGSVQVTPHNTIDNLNRGTSKQLFIPPGISQITLAAGITEFFESQGHSSAALLKTCLIAMDKMTVRMGISEIKDVVDARYRPQDDGNIEETGP